MNRILAATALVLFAVPGFADGVYIGKIDGGPPSARIALVVAGDRFVCYCCSDDKAFNSKCSRWLTGSVGKSGEATAANGGLSLHTSVAGEVLSGGLQTDDGESFEFRAKRIADGSDAGLFRFVQLTDDERLVDGWIVDEDGNLVGERKVGRRKQKNPNPKKRIGNAAGNATGSDSPGNRVAARAGTGVGSSSEKKAKQPVSQKKLGDRVKSIAKKRSDDKAKQIAKKESTAKKESESKKSESEKTSKRGPDKIGVAKNESKKPNRNKTGEGNQTGDKKVATGQKTGTGEKTGANKNEEEGAVANSKKKADKKEGAAAGPDGAAAGVAQGKTKKDGKKEGVEPGENEEEGAVADGKKKKKEGEKEGVAAAGQSGPNKGGKKNNQKQQGEAAGENENVAEAEAAAAAEENVQEQVAAKVGQKLPQQQKVGKIKNVEEVNIIEQEEEAAVEEVEEAPQPVDVENVRIVNRIKPNNQPEAKQNQGEAAPAPLPGEVVEGNLVGVDDEDRVLTVDDGQDVVEIPVGNRQMIVVDENGERAAEEPANAAAQGALKGKPGQMLKKLAADGEVPVRIRIGAKNVVVKQKAAEEQ